MEADDTERDIEALARTTEEVFTLAELRTRLAEGRPLRIKYGVDVTAPFLHIGHAVNLWMMRYLQDRGHHVLFLIGDFTTRIGDPTGKDQTRRIISRDQIEQNAESFIAQAGMVLSTDPSVFVVRRNSEWFEKMSTTEFLSLLSLVTQQRLIARDMFQRRIAAGREVFMHEMIYPVLQGYDSAMLDSDLTIVGSDQLFNEMMGRFYQEQFHKRPQVVMTTKITPGIDGKAKQSKSLGNYIALADTPREKFGKTMSIPDELIVPYLEVYTLVPMPEVESLRAGLRDGSVHPMAAKMRLAQEIVTRYHGGATARGEAEWFHRTFSHRDTPNDIPETIAPAATILIDLLSQRLPGSSRSELRRLIQQGGVSLDNKPLTAWDQPLQVEPGSVLRVGKRRWFRLIPEDRAGIR